MALLTVVGGLVLTLGAPAAAAAADPTFTCRASALRIDTFGPLDPLTARPIEPFVANGDRATCQPDKAALVDQALPAGLGEVAVLFARTGRGQGGSSTAEAGLLDATVNAPAPIGPVGVEVLTSQTTASCNRSTGEETFTGESTIAAIEIGGQRIEPIPGEPQEFTIIGPLAVLEIGFAQQERTAEQITQQALVIEAFDPTTNEKLAEVVVGEAIADVHGCEPPPPPQRSKCNAGAGNGSEPVPPGECDPGRSGKNKGGD